MRLRLSGIATSCAAMACLAAALYFRQTKEASPSTIRQAAKDVQESATSAPSVVAAARAPSRSSWSVQVLDERESPVPGARVRLRDRGGLSIRASRGVDSAGLIRWDHLPQSGLGPMVAQATAAGYVVGEASLESGDREGVVTVRLKKEAVVRGSVVDLAGRPLRGARVSVRAEGYLPPGATTETEPRLGFAATTTGDDGAFALGGLTKGAAASILVECRDYVPTTGAVTAVADGEPVVVQMAAIRFARLDATAGDGGPLITSCTLDVRALDAGAFYVDDARSLLLRDVIARLGDGDRSIKVIALRSDRPIPPAEFELSTAVSSSGFGARVLSLKFAGFESTLAAPPRRVVLVPDGRALFVRATARNAKGAMLTGAASLELDRPRPDLEKARGAARRALALGGDAIERVQAAAAIHRPDIALPRLLLDTHGRSEVFAVPEGDWVPGGDFEPIPIQLRRADADRNGVVEFELVTRPAGSAFVEVRDAFGAPVSTYRFSVARIDGAVEPSIAFHTNALSADGARTEFDRLAPGAYRFTARTAGFSGTIEFDVSDAVTISAVAYLTEVQRR